MLLKEEQRLRATENKELRRVFESERKYISKYLKSIMPI
jgi:hypothetical protein